MKWETDLIKDIRLHNGYDDGESRIDQYVNIYPDIAIDKGVVYQYDGKECTECDRNALLEQFLKVKDTCKAILEIGIGRNGTDSFATVFFENKKEDTVYVGLDIEDRSWLVEYGENIFTIEGDSSNYDEIVDIIKGFGVEQFDFIFIDGDHSVNQVLRDWEYTNLLSENGVVGFHDTSHHTGPYMFIRNLDKEKWDVIENACPEDYGIGFAIKK